MNKCIICEKDQIKVRKVQHKFDLNSTLFECKDCTHKWFELPKAFHKNLNNNDKQFSRDYVEKHGSRNNLDLLKNPFQPTFFRSLSNITLTAMFKHFEENSNILEIGPSFPGIFEVLNNIGIKMNFFAIEPNSILSKKLQKYNVKIIGDHFPSKIDEKYNNYFDFIFLHNVFYYFHDPQEALKQLSNLLKPNGVIQIQVVNSKHSSCNDNYFLNNPLVQLFNTKSLKKLITLCGLDPLYIGSVGPDNSNIYFSHLNSNKSKLFNFIDKLLNRCGLIRSKSAFKGITLNPFINYSETGWALRAVVCKHDVLKNGDNISSK